MKVRELTEDLNRYKGHEIEAGAGGKDCPCLPCFNVHDCGWTASSGKWVHSWDCATRHNSGCPERLRIPIHCFKSTKRFQNRKRGDIFRCVRCGQRLVMGEVNFTSFVPEEKEKP